MPSARSGCSSLIDGFASRRVLVVGDLIADEFIYGEVARVSREAPVLILKYDATETVAGRRRQRGQQRGRPSAGARPLAGLVRTDRGRAPPARQLSPRRRSRRHRACAADYRTPVKTRILAGGVHSAKQQVVRIDREAGWPLVADVSRTFVRKLGPALADCDAVRALRLRIGLGHARPGVGRSALVFRARAPPAGAGAAGQPRIGCSTTAA